jgi:hypothetical protein
MGKGIDMKYADETYKSLTTAGKKLIEKHQDAIEHFWENLPKNYYKYKPMKGYRYYSYSWTSGRQGSSVPRVGETISLKGEFVTVIAKNKVTFKTYRKRKSSRNDNIVNVLFVSKGKDPDTKCHPRFFWENWEDKKDLTDGETHD